MSDKLLRSMVLAAMALAGACDRWPPSTTIVPTAPTVPAAPTVTLSGTVVERLTDAWSEVSQAGRARIETNRRSLTEAI